jgi:phosphoglycolate phosphatase
MTRFIVFDLDGTLVDSQRDLANAANALVRELGGLPLRDDAVAAMVGEGAAVLVRRVLAAAQLDPATPGALSRFLELYDERLVEHTVPYDGIIGVLRDLHGRMPLAVLTNKPQRATDRLVDALDLRRYFHSVIGGDTPLGRKPHPAALLRMCDEMQVSPADTVLVGDSPVDLQTARNAGTQVVLVSYGFGFRFDPGTLNDVTVVNTAAEIAAALIRQD